MYSTIENDMKALKLGGLSKEWQTVEFQSKEQYISDLLKNLQYSQ